MRKIIYLFALALLVPLNVSAQTGDYSLTDFPKFKGEVFQQAVYKYIQYEFRNSPTREREYHPVVSFLFNDDGSLKKAEVVETSGSNTVDSRLLNLCKNFTRKKFMTPAYSEEGPIPCTVTVRFDFRWITPRDFKEPTENKDLGYRTYYYNHYWNPAVSGKDPFFGDRSGHYHP